MIKRFTIKSISKIFDNGYYMNPLTREPFSESEINYLKHHIQMYNFSKKNNLANLDNAYIYKNFIINILIFLKYAINLSQK